MTEPVCVVFLTYNRPAYARETIESFAKNVFYSGDLLAHIADDGTESENYVPQLVAMAVATNRFTGISTTNSKRGGYGRNYNLATQEAHNQAEYIMCIEDDWRLERSLDLGKLVSALRSTDYGCIRLGYIGWTQQLSAEFAHINDDHYLHLLPESPEPHVFAGHPRLETREWQRRVGPWPEGLAPGETEFAVAHLPAAREGVLWPIDMVKPYGDLFVHIGSERSY